MKAVVCHGTGQPLLIEERPDPSPGPGDVVLRIERCGICGSELHLNDGPPRAFPGGMVMGHEFAGEIVAIGSGVSGLRVGQRVAAYPAVGCGDCAACTVGNQILCQTAQHMLAGHVDPKAMISSTIGLGELPAKFAELLGPNNETKVQIAPGG